MGLEKKTRVSKALTESSNFGDNKTELLLLLVCSLFMNNIYIFMIIKVSHIIVNSVYIGKVQRRK